MYFFEDLARFGERTACIDEKAGRLSYRELADVCDAIGTHLQMRRLAFVFCENSTGAVCGYLALLQQRVVPVLLDRHMERELREQLLSVYRPDYLWMPEEMAQEFTGISCTFQKYGYGLYETGEKADPFLYEELALLLTTSGSTGSPKLVRQSYENIQANAASIAQYLALDETERPITTLPMNYTYGLSIIHSHILCGATLILTTHTLMEREFWKIFREERATSFGGVPYTYEILKKLRFFRMELSSLRYMTQAGGKLSPQLHREFAEYSMRQGKKFIVMYGQCEATARMAYLPAEQSLEKYGSMGIAIPGGRLELIDAAGKEIREPDVVGELVYYGANVTLGYAQCREDLQKGDERFGRLETGDMARRDADGYFFIAGRKKRFLKIYGNRVNLDEVERLVKDFAAECECACGGVDDRLYVFVTHADASRREEMKRFLTEKTRLHPSAFVVREVQEIPKNEAGKTLYHKLEKWYDAAQ